MAEIGINSSPVGCLPRTRRRHGRSNTKQSFARIDDNRALLALNGDAIVVRGVEDERALERARAIRVGEWLVTTDGDGRPMILSVALVAEDDAQYQLAHRNGVEVGCRFSLDDFGTGLSSYSYLRNLPVDFVKIDGVFVKNMATDENDYAVVRSINEIAHRMGKRTVAEFVENDVILERIREIGVDYAQGFGIEKPTRLEELRL